jgi:hypothetical protein
VFLHRVELTGRDGGERHVLTVGREDPRVVREARAEPACGLERAGRCRVVLALVHIADAQVACLLDGIREVLLAPLDALLQ